MNFKSIILILACQMQLSAQYNEVIEQKLIRQHSKNVQITRDVYGIAHIKGVTDADAVFGLIYAQCEDDFERVEKNYIEKLGKTAELDGNTTLYQDLLTQIVLDHKDAQADYIRAEPWLKKLLHAQTAAYNFYLQKHPEVKPRILKKFEPWYSLVWTDGSIGAVNTADISDADLIQKHQMYPFFGLNNTSQDFQQNGSNGFAIGPGKSASKNALLYINPHTSFYYRPEIHVESQQGLNAYGAVTWGQFFVYQGFNQHCGWMHTSSNADVSDTFEETVEKRGGVYYYKFQQKWHLLKSKTFHVKSKDNGVLKDNVFKIYYTHNGPIVANKNGKWISLRSFNRSALSLKQSWLRTKARNYTEYTQSMQLKANTSNNTVYADKDGTIAYWHGNYMPKRDPSLDWSKPQDGSLNQYKGLHSLNEMIHVKNPSTSYIQNCNSTPFTVSGVDSPKKTDYPAYMAPDGENFRGINAVRLLSNAKDLDLNSLISLGYNTKLSAFEILIPGFKQKQIGQLEPQTREALDSLFQWDYHSNSNSIATTLAIYWAQSLAPEIRKVYTNQNERDQIENTKWFIQNASSEDLLKYFEATLILLNEKFGTWKTPWGQLNRFQRLDNDDTYHSDEALSLAVPFASAIWGSLPSFNSKPYQNTLKRYGYSGNSFVAAVEFGVKIKAKSLLAGGNSGNKNSPYFNNFGLKYTGGIFKDVFFYEEDILKNTIKKYRPGAE